MKNKPEEVSDKDWDQVLILKEKVREIMNAAQIEVKVN